MEKISLTSKILFNAFMFVVDSEANEAVKSSKRCFQINAYLFHLLP